MKDKQIHIGLTKEDYNSIREKSQKANMTMTDYILNLVLEKGDKKMEQIELKNIVANTINNKYIEMQLELKCNLAFADGDIEKVEMMIDDHVSDKYFYKEHTEFLKDFMMNGYSRYIKKYRAFCEKICSRKESGKRAIISEIEVAKVASYNSTKNKFKKYLIRKANKDMERLKKCLIEFCDDSKFFEIQRKIREMEKLKRDLEDDICSLRNKIKPDIFPDLEEKVEKYKIITANNWLFFSAMFDGLLSELDELDDEITELIENDAPNIKKFEYRVSELYVRFFNLFDDYAENFISLSECEKLLMDIIKALKKLRKDVAEEYGE